MVLMLLMIISSVIYVRNLHILMFSWIHYGLAIVTVGTIMLHIWLIQPAVRSLEAKIPLTASVAIWVLGSVYKRVRMQEARASVHKLYDEITASALETPGFPGSYTGVALARVTLSRNVTIHPGSYFYVHFDQPSRWRKAHAEPLMVHEWVAFNASKSWYRNCQKMTELHFLIRDGPLLSAILSEQDTEVQVEEFAGKDLEVTIDGPYGRDLGLQNYDTVCLVAEGIGIAGALPLARSLVERRAHDRAIKSALKKNEPDGEELLPSIHRDRVKQLNIFWAMESNSDINWIIESLKKLLSLDPKEVSQLSLRLN